MKKTLLLLLTILLTLHSFSQTPSAQSAGGKTGNPPANNGHLYGKVIDSLGKGIGDVSVIVLESRLDKATNKAKDVLVKGMITKNNGEFDFEELPLTGNLTLKISTTGYKALEQSVSFMREGNSGN